MVSKLCLVRGSTYVRGQPLARQRYSLVVEKDIKKQSKQTDTESFPTALCPKRLLLNLSLVSLTHCLITYYQSSS